MTNIVKMMCRMFDVPLTHDIEDLRCMGGIHGAEKNRDKFDPISQASENGSQLATISSVDETKEVL